MAFKNIEQIQIGANPPGRAFGGFIYSFSSTIGTSNSPTTITINVVSKDGFYAISKFDLNSISPIRIKAGDLIFSEMFLTSYEINHSVGNRILTLNFKDASIILDKVHVGLLLRDGEPRNLAPSLNPLENINNYQVFTGTVDIPIHCGPCDSDQVGIASNTVYTLSKPLRGGFCSNVNLRTGGTILIGTEEITDSNCKIADISYSFRELVAVLELIKFRLVGFTDRRSPQIRRNFTGSLRTVLESWCNLLGYSFVWDFATNQIIAIDLTIPVIDTSLGLLKVKIESLKEGSDVVIEDINEAYSIENTVAKDYTSYYLRDARTLDLSRSKKERLTFRNLKISEVVPCEFFGPRNEEELIISSVLGKFSKSARTIYNWKILSECSDFSPLGVSLKYRLSEAEKEKFINYNFQVTDISHIEERYGKRCRVYIGTYSEELENKWIDWESKVADFIGRYYVNDTLVDDFVDCNKDRQYYLSLTSTTQPNSEKFDQKNKHDLPFSELLKHPGGTNINAAFPIWLANRTAVYGNKEETQIEETTGVVTKGLKSILYDMKEKEILSEFIPSFEPIEGAVRLYFSELFRNLFPGLAAKTAEDLKDEKVRPVIIFAPEGGSLESVLSVGRLKGATLLNPYETNKKEEKKEEPCELTCEENTLDKYCCPDDELNSTTDDNIYLSDLRGRNFKMTTKLGSLDIILPSEADYIGNIRKERNYKRTIPGVTNVYGLISRPNNALKFEVESANISADLGEVLDQKGGLEIDSVIVPQGTVDLNNNNVSLEILKAEALHWRTSNPVRITDPAYSLNFKMAGMNYAPISPWLTPQNGLESMSISVDENGINSSFSFSTRPVELPEKDILIDKITKSLRLNIFGRTF